MFGASPTKSENDGPVLSLSVNVVAVLSLSVNVVAFRLVMPSGPAVTEARDRDNAGEKNLGGLRQRNRETARKVVWDFDNAIFVGEMRKEN